MLAYSALIRVPCAHVYNLYNYNLYNYNHCLLHLIGTLSKGLTYNLPLELMCLM